MTDFSINETPAGFPAGSSSFPLAGPAGQLEVVSEVASPDKARRGTAIICHPHPLFGGTMRNKVVTILEKSLRESGLDTIRFNFRGIGQSEGSFDNGIGEGADLAAVAEWVHKVRPDDDLWLAGFSFGSFVALNNAARLGAKALITVAPPVGRGYDFDAIELPTCPWLVIQGEDDEVVDPPTVFAWLDALEKPPVVVHMPEASHFFHRRLLDLRGAVKHAIHSWLPVERTP